LGYGYMNRILHVDLNNRKMDVEQKDASHLANLGAREVEDAIRDEMGNKKIRVAQTGLAGMKEFLLPSRSRTVSEFQ